MEDNKRTYSVGRVYGCKKLISLEKRDNRTVAITECIYCGRQHEVKPSSLMCKNYTSCRCKIIKHGDAGSRLYGIWGNMKYRCFNSRAQGYHNYGGKGVSVCSEWTEYECFKKWALSNGYNNSLCIDRIDSDGNYSPENCRWITASENTIRANQTSQHRHANKGRYYGISPQGEHVEFENASEFSKRHDLHDGCVRRCAHGNRKSHHGWKFGFVNDVESEPQSTIENT